MPQSIDLKARRNARKHAVQAIYQWQLAQQAIREIEHQFATEFLGSRVDSTYFQTLLYGIPENIEAIDASFGSYLSRAQNEIDPVELAVLRLATFELLFRLDIPYQVVINEALELTKTFGTQEGFRFVNGILDKTAKATRQEEYKLKSKHS